MHRSSVCAALVICLLSFSSSGAETPAKRNLWVEREDEPVSLLAGGMPDFTSIAKFARPSVVSITATGIVDSVTPESDHPSAKEFFERFYGGAEPPTKGMASGFIIRSD